MNNNKQTAVEFVEATLLKRLKEVYFISKYDLKLIEKAKAMEKKQIINAVTFGQNNHSVSITCDLRIAEKYYKETHEQETIPQTNITK